MNAFRNMAGYMDRTAGEAINKADREIARKDKEKMMKKRNCRRTMDEKYIHEKAVKMRKMTDEQLVYYVEDRVQKAKSEGIHQGKKQVSKNKLINIGEIIRRIGSVKGIGESKLADIKAILETYLEVDTGV